MIRNPAFAFAFFLVISISRLHGQDSAESQQRWDEARQRLVQLVAEGVQDARVLAAVAATQRHLFVPESQRECAYFDMSLPIGKGVTISPPVMVAFMTEQLDPQPGDKVLEIGTGSGYQAAILSPLVADVYTIEIIESLGHEAAARLERLGYDNVHVKVGDGFQGWPEHAPFDKIIVTCSPESIPEPVVAQLKEGGQMLIPLGARFQQSLCRVTKKNGRLQREVLESTFFVPMTGRAEELRHQKQDDGVPELVNGGFELATARGMPAGWYYLRQAARIADPSAPAGASFLRLQNTTAGRSAQALQAIGLDGRRFAEIEISVTVRSEDVVLAEAGSYSGIGVRFYDQQRARVGAARFGPWRGSSSWAEHGTRFRVPEPTRLVVIGLGLLGATGRLDFDQLEIQARESVTRDSFD